MDRRTGRRLGETSRRIKVFVSDRSPAQATGRTAGRSDRRLDKRSDRRSPQSAAAQINVLVGVPELEARPGVRQTAVLKQLRRSRRERLSRRVKVLVDGQVPIDAATMAQLQREWARQRRERWLYTGSIGGAIALLAFGAWTAFQFMLNPGSVNWLQAWLPSPDRARLPMLGRGNAQTLAEIETEVRRSGLAMGKPLYLSTYPGLTPGTTGFNDFILPILSQPTTCSTTQTARLSRQQCQEIVELRVYRSQAETNTQRKSATFDLLDRMGVVGMTEMAAIAPLVNAGVASGGASQTLALSQVEFVEGEAPAAGIWFHLAGDWYRGSENVMHGKLIHYDPVMQRLQPLMNWTSPVGEPPRWQQVTGDDRAELVVDQSIGTEPQFQVYQVVTAQQANRRFALAAIGLTQPAIENAAYKNALLLAENGLWSPALELLESVKSAANWTTQAQAQLDVVAMHAKVTQAAADRTWASPTEQIVTQLMDGRWAKAWQQLAAARKDGYDISGMLTANVDRLLQRIEVAEKLRPGQSDLQRWRKLLQTVLADADAAIDALQEPAAGETTARSSVRPRSASQQAIDRVRQDLQRRQAAQRQAEQNTVGQPEIEAETADLGDNSVLSNPEPALQREAETEAQVESQSESQSNLQINTPSGSADTPLFNDQSAPSESGVDRESAAAPRAAPSPSEGEPIAPNSPSLGEFAPP